MNQNQQKLNQLRFQLARMSHLGKAAHLASALSCLDLIYFAYKTALNINPSNYHDLTRDHFILSKGHAISALYVVLSEMGFFDKSLLDTFNQNGSSLPEHPTPNCIKGVEFATGSLGHGLSIGCGIALSSKIKKEKFKVMVLLSDGELNEGSVWEAAQFASAKNLTNLIGIVDFNKWQATGRSNEILKLEPLRAKWESFGFKVFEINGHDQLEITTTLKKSISSNSPIMVIAHTIKGKGISFMEDDNNWHYRIPNADEINKIKQELQL